MTPEGRGGIPSAIPGGRVRDVADLSVPDLSVASLHIAPLNGLLLLLPDDNNRAELLNLLPKAACETHSRAMTSAEPPVAPPGL